MDERTITHEGEINLGDFIVPCYVLDDGTRVLAARGFESVLKLSDEQSPDSADRLAFGGTRIKRYLSQKTLQPYIYREKERHHFNPIVCYNGNIRVNGYEASLLVDFCDGILEARKNLKLSSRQTIIADQCEILVRGFARVGIIALIDEATGYQNEREKEALQKILSKYISSQLMPWQKKFPDVFYQELFRLNGWEYNVKGIKKRPGVIGTWTNKLVYDQLPPGVLDALKKQAPKNTKGNRPVRLHQFLTDDIGSPHLATQINQVITLFQLSDNMKHMWKQFEKLQARQSGQISLDEIFPMLFDEHGFSVFEEEKQEPLAEFNRNLQSALTYKETPAK